MDVVKMEEVPDAPRPGSLVESMCVSEHVAHAEGKTNVGASGATYKLDVWLSTDCPPYEAANAVARLSDKGYDVEVDTTKTHRPWIKAVAEAE